MAIFGEITPPQTAFSDQGADGLFKFLSAIFRIAGVAAGIFFIIKIIMAGYSYLTADGDPKKTSQAFAIIWQSAIGFAIVASAFVLASVIGGLFGIDILNPTF